ncbi:LytTR family DNA-binding domain-containing protein [uncultured Chryseobacterium sp.]|uniref:LytR/AlgR family response regulator transcription factor n=1 Tax=uncultured Chryseobacterium sp. TaxID=259322 RepID=UPI00258FE15C|nr:LytTR family DNA-binding domain-containing protein [uncultured Chryseobacterium sp.]
MNVLIIEDEIRTARELQRMLLQIDDTIHILGIIDSVADAVDFLKQNREIDLLFSDIQLVDGNSFEIHRQELVNCPIVFCTAFDEFVLEAFKTNALSYILKPATADDIEKALAKYRTIKNNFQSSFQAAQLQKASAQLGLGYKSTLLVDQREKIIPISIKDVAFCYLENSWIKIVTTNNQKYTLSSSLEVLEKQLNPQQFFRVNRQFLVNRNAIRTIERFFSRKLVVKLSLETPEQIIVSKAKSGDFLRWLEG